MYNLNPEMFRDRNFQKSVDKTLDIVHELQSIFPDFEENKGNAIAIVAGIYKVGVMDGKRLERARRRKAAKLAEN